jgi:ATP-binding cassette subfamily F protein 3
LLDEPTNHLDIAAQEVLQEVVEGFEGTTLLVTHDRYLVDRLATQIWHLEYGHLHVFKGTYQEYLAARKTEHVAARVARAEAKRQERAERLQSRKKSAHPELEKLAAQIQALETSQRELTMLIQRAKNSIDMQRLSQQYAESQAKLDALLVEWEAAAEPA